MSPILRSLIAPISSLRPLLFFHITFGHASAPRHSPPVGTAPPFPFHELTIKILVQQLLLISSSPQCLLNLCYLLFAVFSLPTDLSFIDLIFPFAKSFLEILPTIITFGLRHFLFPLSVERLAYQRHCLLSDFSLALYYSGSGINLLPNG